MDKEFDLRLRVKYKCMESMTYVKYNKEFDLRLRELPLADQTGARCDLVPECFADLRWAREPLYTLYFILSQPRETDHFYTLYFIPYAEPAMRDRLETKTTVTLMVAKRSRRIPFILYTL